MAKSSKISVYSAESVLRHPAKLVREMFAEVWSCRELTWILFIRDLKAQYRQSYAGYIWLFIPPVVTAGVWFFLNNQRIVQVDTDVPYPLFVLVGTTIWMSFTDFLQKPLAGFNSGKAVFMKLNVPAEAFVMSSVLRAIFEMAIRTLLIVPLLFAYQFSLTWTAVLFPLGLLSVMIIGTALGMLLIPLGSLYGDVASAVSTFVRLLMYLVPVVYPIPEGNGILALLMRWNPLTPSIAFSRDVLLSGSTDWWLLVLLYSGLGVFAIFVASVILRVAKPHLVARMGM